MTHQVPAAVRALDPRASGAAFRRLFSGLALALLAGAAVAQGPVQVRIEGSDSMLVMNRRLAEAYGELDPSLRLTVEGEGSETGLRALLEGTTDIAASSRALTDEERAAFRERFDGQDPREVVVAQDGIHVYVHTSNPVSRLTLDQLARILAGQVRNWEDVGGLDRRIDLYNRNDDSGTRTYLERRVLGRRTFSDRALDVPSSAQLIAAVASNPRAIGYSGAMAVRGARTLRIAADPDSSAVRATVDTVASGAYPLTRPLYFYVAPSAWTPRVQAFVDWVLSPAGQRIATFSGFFPAPGRSIREAPAPAPRLDGSERRSDPIRLTPESMGEHGFRLAVTIAGEGPERPRDVTVIFSPRGETIASVTSIELRIGAEAQVPLALGPDLSLAFALREPWIASATLRLVAEREGLPPLVYEIRLDDFRS